MERWELYFSSSPRTHRSILFTGPWTRERQFLALRRPRLMDCRSEFSSFAGSTPIPPHPSFKGTVWPGSSSNIFLILLPGQMFWFLLSSSAKFVKEKVCVADERKEATNCISYLTNLAFLTPRNAGKKGSCLPTGAPE